MNLDYKHKWSEDWTRGHCCIEIRELGRNQQRLSWWLRRQRIHLQCARPKLDPLVRKIPWRKEWQPTSVFLPGEFHGQRSLVGYSSQGHKELDTIAFSLLATVSRRKKWSSMPKCTGKLRWSIESLDSTREILVEWWRQKPYWKQSEWGRRWNIVNSSKTFYFKDNQMGGIHGVGYKDQEAL